MADPHFLKDVLVGMYVKVAISKIDPSDKWISSQIKEILTTSYEYHENGIEVIITDNRSGYVKEFLEDITKLTEIEVLDLVKRHETLNFELKSSFQYSVKNKRKAECLAEQIVREICGFMNARGGIICIGVDNSKSILGLEDDYSILTNIKPGQPKSDSLIQTIRDFVNSRLGDNILETLYNSYIVNLSKSEVCIIDVKESKNIPVFVLEKFKSQDCDSDDNKPLSNKKRWLFYVRTDRGTSEKNPYEAAKYWKNEKNSQFL